MQYLMQCNNNNTNCTNYDIYYYSPKINAFRKTIKIVKRIYIILLTLKTINFVFSSHHYFYLLSQLHAIGSYE